MLGLQSKRLHSVLMVVLFSISSLAQAEYVPGFRVDDRQAALERMIQQSMRNGRLTHEDAAELWRMLNRVERREWRYREDGLERWEARDLLDMLDRVDGRLRDYLNHQERRYPSPPRPPLPPPYSNR